MLDVTATFDKEIREEFWRKSEEEKSDNALEAPRLIQTAAGNEEEKLGKEVHRIFGSGVRSLLYPLKHSRLALSNPMRESSGCKAGPMKNMEEMHGAVKWVLDRPNVGLRMHPKVTFNDKGEVTWRLDRMCDSTLESNKEDGKSATGCVPHFMGTPVAWKSKR